MQRTSNGVRSQRGFTIFELLVVIGITAVLLGIAAVATTQYMRRQALRGAVRDLIGDIGQVRNYVRVRQEANVVLQFAPRLYTAWVDSNTNQVYEPTAPFNEPLVLERSLGTGVQLGVASTGAGVVPPVTTLRFTAIGSLRDANRIFTIGLDGEPQRLYRIILYTTGTMSFTRSDDGGATFPTYE